MKREEKLMHDDGSCTIEGDRAGEYLQHDWEHKKGKGDEEEHTGQIGHEEMHKIPHNENPISDWIGKGVEKVKNLAEDYGKNISGTLTQNPSSLKKVRDKQGPGFYQADIGE